MTLLPGGAHESMNVSAQVTIGSMSTSVGPWRRALQGDSTSGEAAAHHAAEARDALFDQLCGAVRVVEPEHLVPGRLGEERAARDERHLLAERLGEDLV